MEKRKSIRNTLWMKVITVLLFITMVTKVLYDYGSSDSPPEYPGYKKENIESLVDIEKVYEGNVTREEERNLFLQTGLGKSGISAIRNDCNGLDEFEETLSFFQIQLFEGEGDKRLVDLQTGDVLVSMSQRLCFYPHGHAAIVIDGEEEVLLEARSHKVGSCQCKGEKWAKLSSFVVLRLKDEVREAYEEEFGENPAQKAAEYAKENLDGLKYSLFKDLRPLSGSTPEYTQCAHLVWYAYFVGGLDIDENRGVIIKPKDFLKSDVFEVVQVFGICPNKLLGMRSE